MQVNEITNPLKSFQNWKDKRTELPVPPKTNLFHATLSQNLPNIMQKGLIPDGVCKLYQGCTAGQVYLTDNAGLAATMVAPDQHKIDQNALEKSGGKGIMLTINSSLLDPALLSQDTNLMPNWLSPKFSYMYAGVIPSSAIISKEEFTIQETYYLNKSFRGMTPGKAGAVT